jgi:hypothetical protein
LSALGRTRSVGRQRSRDFEGKIACRRGAPPLLLALSSPCQMGLPPSPLHAQLAITKVPELRERCFGVFEGKIPSEAATEFPGALPTAESVGSGVSLPRSKASFPVASLAPATEEWDAWDSNADADFAPAGGESKRALANRAESRCGLTRTCLPHLHTRVRRSRQTLSRLPFRQRAA